MLSLQLTHREWLLALFAFVSVAAMYMIYPWVDLHPQVWGDVASALDLKSGIAPEHGLWRYCVRLLVGLSSRTDVPFVLHVMGLLSGAFCAVVMYLLLCMLVPMMFRAYTWEIIRVRPLVDILILGLVWMLALSEGYWNIFRFFTVQTWLVLMVMVAVLMQLMFMANGRIRYLLACYFVTGLLAGGSALGLILLVVILLVFFGAKHRWGRTKFLYLADEEYGNRSGLAIGPGLRGRRSLMNPLVAERLKTPVAFVFLLGFFLSAVADISFMMRLPGATLGNVLVDSAKAYVHELASYADTMDLIRASLLAAAPLVANLWFCRLATDTEKLLPRRLSILYLVTGLASYTQLSGVSCLWFWTWGGPLMPLSPIFLAMVSFLSLFVVATSLMVFVVDACCRDVRNLVDGLCSDENDFLDEAVAVLGHTIAVGGKRIIFFKSLIFVILVFGLCCLSVPSRRQVSQRTVIAAVTDFAREVAREVSGCKLLVTNGALDDLLRLDLFRCRTQAQVVSLKALPHLDDLGSVEVGWMTDLPWCHYAGGWNFSGLVARRNVCEQEAVVSRNHVLSLAERFIALEENGTMAGTHDRFLKNASNVVEWHLARALNLQLQMSDGKLSAEEAIRVENLVKALDRNNGALQGALAKLDGVGMQANVVLTPAEGLSMAVNRGDFELARRYVDVLLAEEPANALALYARGMIFLKDGQNVRAAEVLQRAAAAWPDEPAVLNNLAVAVARAGQRDAARKWMRKAAASSRADEVVRANAAVLLKDD